ncbi:MAG: von Willebrand factor type A domain-containing protein, partial [Planctomycetota bacterium]
AQSERALLGLRSTLGMDAIADSTALSKSADQAGLPSPYYRLDDVEYIPAPPQSGSGSSPSEANKWSFGLQMADNAPSPGAPAPELALPSLVPETESRSSVDALALSIEGKDSFDSSVPAFGGFDADFDGTIPESAGTELALDMEVIDEAAIPFAPSDTPDQYFENSRPQRSFQPQDFFDSGIDQSRRPGGVALAENGASSVYDLPDTMQDKSAPSSSFNGGGMGGEGGGMGGGGGGFGGGGGAGRGGRSAGGRYGGGAERPDTSGSMYGGTEGTVETGSGMGMGGMGAGMGMGGDNGASDEEFDFGATDGGMFFYGGRASSDDGDNPIALGERGSEAPRRRAGGRQAGRESEIRLQQRLNFGVPSTAPAELSQEDRFIDNILSVDIDELDLSPGDEAKTTNGQDDPIVFRARRWESLGTQSNSGQDAAPVAAPDGDALLLGGVAVQPSQKPDANLPAGQQSQNNLKSNWFGSMPATGGLNRPEVSQQSEPQLGQVLKRLSKKQAPQSNRDRARAYFFQSEGRSISPDVKREQAEVPDELAAFEDGYDWKRNEAAGSIPESVFVDPGVPSTDSDIQQSRGFALSQEMQIERGLAEEIIRQSEAKAGASLRALALQNRFQSNVDGLVDKLSAALPPPPAGAESGVPQPANEDFVGGTWRVPSESKMSKRFSESISSNGVVQTGDVVLGKNPYVESAPSNADKQGQNPAIFERFSRESRLSGRQGREKYLGKIQVSKGLGEKSTDQEAFSTFSLHVSDVSFKLAYDALTKGEWPERDKVRIEEFVNAFDYGDPLPGRNSRVACQVEQAIHPFLQQRNLMRVSLRTSATGRAKGKPLSLTLLLDNSGSMERPDRRATVQRAFAMLASQLGSSDVVTLISFANQPRLLADRVSGDKAAELVEKVQNLPSEGGTNLEAALQLAFAKAQEQKIQGSQNRVVLLTDGAVNLGDADPERLANIVLEMREADIAFDAAGISAQDLNDDVLETLTRNGDGRYYLL